MSFETKDSGARVDLANGMVRDTSEGKIDYTLLLDGPLFKRWAELLTRGAVKYGKRNWCKSFESPPGPAREETRERFRESAMRHFMQWLDGDRSEDHAAAVLFNLNGYEALRDVDERRASEAIPQVVLTFQMTKCVCNETFRTAEDYRDHLPCSAGAVP